MLIYYISIINLKFIQTEICEMFCYLYCISEMSLWNNNQTHKQLPLSVVAQYENVCVSVCVHIYDGFLIKVTIIVQT